MIKKETKKTDDQGVEQQVKNMANTLSVIKKTIEILNEEYKETKEENIKLKEIIEELYKLYARKAEYRNKN